MSLENAKISLFNSFIRLASFSNDFKDKKDAKFEICGDKHSSLWIPLDYKLARLNADLITGNVVALQLELKFKPSKWPALIKMSNFTMMRFRVTAV